VIASPFEFLFPRYCLGCHRPGLYFCPHCLSKIGLLERQLCPVCEKPSVGGQTHLACQPATLDGLISVFVYDGIIKKSIQALKYQFVFDLSESLVDLMMRKLTSFFIEEGIVIPVPLSSPKKKWRGFNQAEMLGKIFARKAHLGFNPQILERVVDTPPQVGLDAAKRKENLKGAFRTVDSRLIKNKALIIFDDVWTTGATLKNCASVLKKEGAGQVWGLTLAR